MRPLERVVATDSAVRAALERIAALAHGDEPKAKDRIAAIAAETLAKLQPITEPCRGCDFDFERHEEPPGLRIRLIERMKTPGQADFAILTWVRIVTDFQLTSTGLDLVEDAKRELRRRQRLEGTCPCDGTGLRVALRG